MMHGRIFKNVSGSICMRESKLKAARQSNTLCRNPTYVQYQVLSNLERGVSILQYTRILRLHSKYTRLFYSQLLGLLLPQ